MTDEPQTQESLAEYADLFSGEKPERTQLDIAIVACPNCDLCHRKEAYFGANHRPIPKGKCSVCDTELRNGAIITSWSK